MEKPFSDQYLGDVPQTPEGKWADISKRLNTMDETGMTISQNIKSLPNTDERQIEWGKIVRKVKEVEETLAENCDLGKDPDPEIYELLSEAEEGIKKFVN